MQQSAALGSTQKPRFEATIMDAARHAKTAHCPACTLWWSCAVLRGAHLALPAVIRAMFFSVSCATFFCRTDCRVPGTWMVPRLNNG